MKRIIQFGFLGVLLFVAAAWFISTRAGSAAVEPSAADAIPVEVIAEHGVGDGHPATEVPIGRVADLATDPAGNIYFVDAVHLRVRRIAPDGTADTVLNGHSLDGPSSPRAVALSVDLAVGTAVYVADDRANRVWVIRDEKVQPFAGTGAHGLSGDGGPATEAQFRVPADLAVAPDGTVYIADVVNHRIRAVATGGGINTVAGDLSPDVDIDAALTSSSLFKPEFVAVGADGLYVVDRQRRRLQRLFPDGSVEDLSLSGTVFSGLATTADGALLFTTGAVLEQRDGMSVRFGETPRSFTAVAPFGPDAVVAYDSWANRLYRIQRDGSETLVGGNGTEGSFGDGGPANGACFSCYDVAVNSKGEILFSDPFNRRIAIIHEDGTIATVAGGEEPSAAAALATPLGIAIDSGGGLYVADRGMHRIVRVSRDGTMVSVAGNGTAESNGDGGRAIDASLDGPSDVVVAGSGELFISESGSRRIRRIDPSGTIWTVATLSSQAESLALDSDGNLIVTSLVSAQPIVIPQSSEAVAVEVPPYIPVDDERLGGSALVAGSEGSLLFASWGKLVMVTGSRSERLPVVLPASVTGMTLDSRGNLVLCDAMHQRILRISAPGLQEAAARIFGG